MLCLKCTPTYLKLDFNCLYYFLFQIVGFFWGLVSQQLSAAIYTVLAGFVLSCLVSDALLK